MKISQEELERRLKSPRNVVNRLRNPKEISEKNPKGAGRPEGKSNAPESLRKLAGLTANIEGNAVVTARALNLSPEQTRYAQPPTAAAAREIALNRLMDTLGLINPLQIADEKPREQVAIAAGLSKVYRNLAPDVSSTDRTNISITMYSPKLNTIEDYEVIDVEKSA